ncbi:MAG: ATP-dependent RNA helicase HrpA, partial [Pirellulaceae bacterium]
MNGWPSEPRILPDQVMRIDSFRLRRLGQRIERARRDGRPSSRMEEQYEQQLATARELYERRVARRPQVTYDSELPITAHRDTILRAIDEHPVVVVCGETGSGKSTQLPKMCLELGRGVRGVIGHTQPRRIAARSVATRLAEELGSRVGESVGFKVRFSDTTGPNTYVKLMTDGMLLAETQGDRFLDQYDTLIVDEAHERSLNIDFLLGYVHRLLPRRPDFRLIITSATIDAARFSDHFRSASGPAPVISVEGRTYPVEVWYRPPPASDDDDEPDRRRAVLDAIDELTRIEPHGDILVFLATEREILEVAKALRGRVTQSGRPLEILPLYARLSVAEQQRVFAPHARRRVVLATNVAESSLTVPGIRYVVDEGTARISRYAARSKIQRLPIEPVSRASADQRKGRCGRLGPGICVRLYSEQDYLGLDAYTPPEIRRSNLAAVILQAESLRLGRLEDFPFLDPPQPHLIRDGYTTLYELGAVDAEQQLTEIGRALSRLPTDPRIGRILLGGIAEGCLRDILIIAAALEVQDPRERPADKQQAADEAHAQFADPDSDFLTYLRLWQFYHRLRDKLSRNKLHKACHQNFLSPTRMHEWLEVYRQLRQLVDEHLPEARSQLAQPPIASAENPAATGDAQQSPALDRQHRRQREAFYGQIHRALLVGLLSNVALRTDVHEYTGAGNIKLQLWPGSATFLQKPKWIVAAELIETTRRYARCAAGIQPGWIEPLARHLVNRSYSEPYWDGKAGATMAQEKVTLFGLPVAARRSAPYGPVDPEYARELFIRHGLVGGDVPGSAPFLTHNRQLRAQTDRLTVKSRRTDLVVDDFALFAFYNKRVPADVYDWARLNRWRRHAEQQDARRLYMTVADMTAAEELPRPEEFPDTLSIDHLQLPLEYRFEPGGDADGVTMVVPRAGLAQVPIQRLGWLVPGLLEQKVEAIIRALPKDLRRNLIPVPDTVRKVMDELAFDSGDFMIRLAAILSRLAGENIPVELLNTDKLPAYLRMNIRVVDEAGRTVET